MLPGKGPSNKRFERTGACDGLCIEELEGAMSRSFDQTVRQVGWSARRSSARRWAPRDDRSLA